MSMEIKKHTLALMFLFCSAFTHAQVSSSPGYVGTLFHRPSPPVQLPGPAHLEDFVKDGKLRLGLDDALLLTLENNTDINVDRIQYDLSRFALPRAYGIFDPSITAGFSPTRSVSPTTSSLQGAATLSSLNQTTNINYTQEFQTGTMFGAGLITTRSTSNSSFSIVNPSFFSGLTFSVGQPLWRKGGIFANRAPIMIAQRGIRQSQATFQAQASDIVSRAINQYWDVVEAHKNLEVIRKSVELADASYKRDKRALELGALPPLEIYRSESQVAQRKIALIQAEYNLKRVEETFRQTIGADLDPRIGALDLDLTENVESSSLATVDLPDILNQALKNRSELDAQHQQLSIDDVNVRVANNNLKPDLNLSANYTSNGLGGVSFANSAAGPVVISNGGFGDSVSQLAGFNFPTYGMSLQLRLPIRNRAAAADLGSALVSKKNDLYKMRSLQQAISIEVKNAVHDLEQSELIMTAAQASRDLAAKTLSAEERKYQLGAGTIFFVLDAQNQLSAAELALVQSQIAYRRALTEVDHASGSLLAKHKVSIASTP
jgi:outer membrane protein TolC